MNLFLSFSDNLNDLLKRGVLMTLVDSSAVKAKFGCEVLQGYIKDRLGKDNEDEEDLKWRQTCLTKCMDAFGRYTASGTRVVCLYSREAHFAQRIFLRMRSPENGAKIDACVKLLSTVIFDPP